MTLTVIVIVYVISVEQARECQRRHPDTLPPDIEGNRQIPGEGGGPFSRSRRVNQWLRGHREPRFVIACRGEYGAVQRGRSVLQQPRHGSGARNDVFPMGVAHRLAALDGEEGDGAALCDDECKEQQQREPAREALGDQPHSHSTLPANR